MQQQDPDILNKLNRILAVTPDDAYAVPQLNRKTLLAAATEIRTLRERVTELQAQTRSAQNDLIAAAAQTLREAAASSFATKRADLYQRAAVQAQLATATELRRLADPLQQIVDDVGLTATLVGTVADAIEGDPDRA
jgi:alanyl-tRNA synthetase